MLMRVLRLRTAGIRQASVAASLAGAALWLSPPALGASSLPAVSGGARPGPDLLYQPAPAAPQLENTGIWTAPPILVSGAEAYRKGEFLYQDYLFDDHGGAGIADPNDPFTGVANLFSPIHGTLTYPTNTALYGNNAADLVELRVKPTATATAFRITLNTLHDPNLVAFTVALGDSAIEYAWPFGAGVSSPAQEFLTVHGTTAVLTDATTGHVLSPAPVVSVDTTRRQFQVLVSHAAWDPGLSTVRMAAGVGLWDVAGDTYLKPGPTASATQPGGASPDGEALFNMAFRTDEPQPEIYNPGIANTIAEGGVLVKEDGSWWRERRQADVLASGDVSVFSAEVDFAKLAARTDDESGVPQSGNIDRIFASRFAHGQGIDYTVMCLTGSANCTGRYVGQLQPYALYVPHKPTAARGFGLVITMHGLSANYNEFLGSHEAEQLGERGTGSIVASPEGRGPDGSYASYAEADVFEMWADIARRYRLNPDLTDVTGYSMGGGGTYSLATQWPDLWARAFPIVGPPSSSSSFVNLRNIPVLAWYGQNDELVGPEMSEQAFVAAEQAGIRYDHWVFTPAGHITEGNNDEFGPAATFFGAATVDRNPAHVTYYYDPSTDDPVLGAANHAYWLSAIALRDPSTAGKLDVRSLAGGLGDPPVEAVAPGAGTLNGGSHGPIPYTRRTIAWGTAPSEPRQDELVLSATNVKSVTIDAPRAGVSCAAKVQVTSDGPIQVVLAGCDLRATAPRGRTTLKSCVGGRSLVLHLARTVSGRRVAAAMVSVDGGPRHTIRAPRLTLRVSLVHSGRRLVVVRIVYRLVDGRRVAVTRRYRTCT
jgi:hypothetical protein